MVRKDCSAKPLDHAVLVVGYGVEKKTCAPCCQLTILEDHRPILSRNIPYWIVKNSWGKDWGLDVLLHFHGFCLLHVVLIPCLPNVCNPNPFLQGYILIERGDDMCGVQKEPVSAVIKA